MRRLWALVLAVLLLSACAAPEEEPEVDWGAYQQELPAESVLEEGVLPEAEGADKPRIVPLTALAEHWHGLKISVQPEQGLVDEGRQVLLDAFAAGDGVQGVVPVVGQGEGGDGDGARLEADPDWWQQKPLPVQTIPLVNAKDRAGT